MNQITLPAADLKQALPGLSKVVSRKTTLPVLQSVRVRRALDGFVTLSATDLDTFVTYRVENPQPGEPLDVLLPFEQLNKTGKGSDVVVIPEAKLKARLKYQVSGSSLEQSVTTLAPDEFPPTPKITEVPVKMPENFGETLRQAFETSSQDSSRYVLQGAYPKSHSIGNPDQFPLLLRQNRCATNFRRVYARKRLPSFMQCLWSGGGIQTSHL